MLSDYCVESHQALQLDSFGWNNTLSELIIHFLLACWELRKRVFACHSLGVESSGLVQVLSHAASGDTTLDITFGQIMVGVNAETWKHDYTDDWKLLHGTTLMRETAKKFIFF